MLRQKFHEISTVISFPKFCRFSMIPKIHSLEPFSRQRGQNVIARLYIQQYSMWYSSMMIGMLPKNGANKVP